VQEAEALMEGSMDALLELNPDQDPFHSGDSFTAFPDHSDDNSREGGFDFRNVGLNDSAEGDNNGVNFNNSNDAMDRKQGRNKPGNSLETMIRQMKPLPDKTKVPEAIPAAVATRTKFSQNLDFSDETNDGEGQDSDAFMFAHFCSVPPSVLHPSTSTQSTDKNTVRSTLSSPATTKTSAEFPRLSRAVRTQIVMRAGEMLYLPAGWFHEVTSFSSSAALSTFALPSIDSDTKLPTASKFSLSLSSSSQSSTATVSHSSCSQPSLSHSPSSDTKIKHTDSNVCTPTTDSEGHLAFNFWMHPPVSTDFEQPYNDEYWQWKYQKQMEAHLEDIKHQRTGKEGNKEELNTK
jgi:hypothetical protein